MVNVVNKSLTIYKDMMYSDCFRLDIKKKMGFKLRSYHTTYPTSMYKL